MSTPPEQPASASEEDNVEAIARILCIQHGSKPDDLEPGDADGVDGVLPNGDKAHFRWKDFRFHATQLSRYVSQATAALTARVTSAENGERLAKEETSHLREVLATSNRFREEYRALEAAKAQIVDLRECLVKWGRAYAEGEVGQGKGAGCVVQQIDLVLAKTTESYASLAVIDRKRLAELEAGNQRLLNVARGCFDYSGGHREVKLEIFHHGIQTVINALEAAVKNDPNNTQVNALERMGVAAKSRRKGGEQT